MDATDRCPAFAVACERLRDFLSSRGHPVELVWLFREDFFHASFRRPVVRVPLPADNDALAERYYEAGRARGGVPQLRAQFAVDGHSGCTLWFPGDVSGPGPQALTELRLSAASPFVEATTVRSWLAWQIHRLRPVYRTNQRGGFDIPRRRELQ